MGMMDKMMGMMMGKMSKEEKDQMMDKMMNKMMGECSQEEKMEMMMTMMPKMMEGMNMMEMMPQMMSTMMSKMGAHEDGNPMQHMMMNMMPICLSGILQNVEREKGMEFANKIISNAIMGIQSKLSDEDKEKIKEHIAMLLN